MKYIALIWGVLGVNLFIGSAIFRLSARVNEAFMHFELSTAQWVGAVLWLIFMLRSEGYKGFQKKFSPRVAARTRYLANNPTILRMILAPFFCMGFFHATRKRMITSWALTTMIVCLVLIVSQLDQPLRGIVDLGVVGGLAWGLISLWIFTAQALLRKNFNIDPEVA